MAIAALVEAEQLHINAMALLKDAIADLISLQSLPDPGQPEE